MQVALTDYEFADCVGVGLRRLLSSNTKGLNHASTYERGHLKRLEEETLGACGERAFCKALGIYWDGSVDTFHTKADAGVRYEIRSTTRDDGRLIIRDNDDPDRIYVLVTGQPPRMTVRGWILGSWARQPSWRTDPYGYRPAWFVPQNALNQNWS